VKKCVSYSIFITVLLNTFQVFGMLSTSEEDLLISIFSSESESTSGSSHYEEKVEVPGKTKITMLPKEVLAYIFDYLEHDSNQLRDLIVTIQVLC